jgi:DNA-binding response OmpR family regulator
VSGSVGLAPGPAIWTDAAESPTGLVIDRDQRRVFLDGQEIELVYQEFELLEFLAAHPSRAFTRGQIVAGAWSGHRPPSGRTVDIHIHRLRRKLGPSYARHLVTVQRVGYLFRPPQPAATP